MKKTTPVKSNTGRSPGPARKGRPAAGKPENAATEPDALPGKEEIAAAQALARCFMDNPAQARTRACLDRLGRKPPQVLLLEGGSAGDRLAAAHYWMLRLNCPAVLEERAEPCLVCPECVRMLTHLHRDIFFLDGTAGSIKTDDVRAVRAVLGEPPREARYRVVLFREAQSLVEAAANALLKSFEDPRPGTSFVLLSPQRERLLPTLVSRSLTLTLPWPKDEVLGLEERLAPWEAALCAFLTNGQGFFERSGGKGAVDAALVQDMTNRCRRLLARRFLARQSGAAPAQGLESLLALLPLRRLRILDEALAECQDSLLYNVNPTLVLEWLVTRLYLLVPRAPDGRRPGGRP